MSLFRQKINPHCLLTFRLGPDYVERVFDSILILRGVKNVGFLKSKERYKDYLEYLQEISSPSRNGQYSFIQFYRGHFYHQLAKYSDRSEGAHHFREKSLCYYQTFLEFPNHPPEMSFFALWQMGEIMDYLKYPWEQVQVCLLKAHSSDPSRGEPYAKIVRHYMLEGAWKTAYSFSARAIDSYLNNCPVEPNHWFIEKRAYDWNILDTHLIICYKMRFLSEVKRNLTKFLRYKCDHGEECINSHLSHIIFFDKILGSSIKASFNVLKNTDYGSKHEQTNAKYS
jgi:hypothetical protein